MFTISKNICNIMSFSVLHFILLRKEGDSNPRNALGVYTLSRRASSTARASFLYQSPCMEDAHRNFSGVQK